MKMLIAAFIPLFTAACNTHMPDVKDLPRVEYMVVRECSIVLTTDLPGRVSALSLSEVRPRVDGIILERLFEEG